MIRTEIDRSVIPASCLEITDKLEASGKRVLLAGGCVRDLLLGITPHDFDIATDSTPDETIALFPGSIPVGKQFGVVIVPSGDINYEIATFRKDLSYSDSRHPDGIEFSSPEEDARRRDFTINALFYDPSNGGIIDHVNGRKDLEDGVLRTIGNPDDRFSEDALRLLRAVRFAVRFQLRINKDTLASLKANRHRIEALSPERIKDELTKIFTGPKPGTALRILDRLGLLDHWLPEIAPLHGTEQSPVYHPEGDVFEHTVRILEKLAPPWSSDPACAWAAILHDIGKPAALAASGGANFVGHDKTSASMTGEILSRLKFSNSLSSEITAIVSQHQRFQDAPVMRKGKLKVFLAQPHIEKMLAVHRADCLASVLKTDSHDFCIQTLEKWRNDSSLNPPQLITGADLIALKDRTGIGPGPLFKKILDHIRILQLEEKITTKEEAINEVVAKKWKDS